MPSIIVAHQGRGQSSQFWYTSSSDGIHWAPDQQIANVGMSAAPASVAFQNQLYFFHQGAGQSGQLWYTSSSSASLGWNPDTPVPGAEMSESPAVAVDASATLYCFFQGRGRDGNLWYTSSSDGSNWADTQQVQNVGMSESPALAVFRNQLYCFHQGSHQDGSLWRATLQGTKWVDTQVKDVTMSNVTISKSPALAVFGNRLYCFYQGSGQDGSLRYTASSDGSSWDTPQQIVDVGMSESPAAAVLGGRLYCFHQGSHQDSSLWYTSFDGFKWDEDRPVLNVGMSAAPAAISVNVSVTVSVSP